MCVCVCVCVLVGGGEVVDVPTSLMPQNQRVRDVRTDTGPVSSPSGVTEVG